MMDSGLPFPTMASAVLATGPHLPKTFGDLLREVLDPGRCTECLMCMAACAREGCDNVSLVGDTFHYVASQCQGDGMCYVSCPVLESLDLALMALFGAEESALGRVGVVTSVMSAEWAPSGAGGGAIGALIRYLFHAREIDAAGVLAPDEATGFRLVREGDPIVAHPSGTGFRKPDVVRFLRDLHRSEGRLRLALVAPPCQARMVRKMQLNAVPPSPDVVALIGPFCYATLSNARWRRGAFERAVSPEGRLVESVEVGDAAATVTYRDGSQAQVDLDRLTTAFDSSCLACTDYTNRLADLSVGSPGSSPGFETVVARTEAGELILAGALEEGFLVEWTAVYRERPEAVEARLLQAVEARSDAKAELAQGYRRPR